MPEGPEVRRMALRLARVLVGQERESLWLASPRIAAHQAALQPLPITAVNSHGKAFLIEFGPHHTLYVHLQLYGRWAIHRLSTEPRSSRAVRLEVCTPSHKVLLYSATDLAVLSPAERKRHPFLRKLGPDVFDPELTAAAIAARLHAPEHRRRQLAGLLLDQAFLAGIGNYLRAEICFEAGIDPQRRAGSLDPTESEALGAAVLGICQRALDHNGTTTDAELQALGRRRGWPRRSTRHYVFGRDGQRCFVCESPLEKAALGGRRMYWCPACQT